MEQPRRLGADEFMLLLAEACPTIALAVLAERDRARADRDDPVWIEVIGQLPRHLGELLRRGETGRFPTVFAAVERGLVEGDDRVRDALADEIVEGLTSEMATHCDPEEFAPHLGPAASERLAYLRRVARPPDPGAEDLFQALVRHNPARLEGNPPREYRWMAKYLPSLLDKLDSFALMRRGLWRYAMFFVPPKLVGPEERFDAIAREEWERRHGGSVADSA